MASNPLKVELQALHSYEVGFLPKWIVQKILNGMYLS